MSKVKAVKYGLLSLSASLLLAGCNGEDEPTETSPSEEETAGIQGIELPVPLNNAIGLFYETFESEDISIDSIQFEEDDGRYIYAFDGWDGEFAYELKVDAETSEVFDQEQEEDSETEDELNLEDIIDPIEAMDAALEASGSGYVEEWELEVENDQTIYDIDVEDGDDQRIDAVSGEAM